MHSLRPLNEGWNLRTSAALNGTLLGCPRTFSLAPWRTSIAERKRLATSEFTKSSLLLLCKVEVAALCVGRLWRSVRLTVPTGCHSPLAGMSRVGSCSKMEQLAREHVTVYETVLSYNQTRIVFLCLWKTKPLGATDDFDRAEVGRLQITCTAPQE